MTPDQIELRKWAAKTALENCNTIDEVPVIAARLYDFVMGMGENPLADLAMPKAPIISDSLGEIPITKPRTPVKEAADAYRPTKTLTVSQYELLERMIAASDAGNDIRLKDYANPRKLPISIATKIAAGLIEAGYISKTGSGPGTVWTVLYRPTGEKYVRVAPVMIGKVRFTKCPTRFAGGYSPGDGLAGEGGDE